MKNIFFLIFIIFFVSCQTNETTQNKDNNIDQLFLNNCMTVESYLKDFVNESIASFIFPRVI